MKASPKKSIEFLNWFRPGGPWVLSAIVPGGRITTSTFQPDQTQLLEEWIEARSGHENIYFQVNSTGDKMVTKKPTKNDIVSVDWLHVDVDPSADSELFEAERGRILKKLQAHAPEPSLIIDSGGGYQAFWRLSQSWTGEWSEIERYNQQIEAELGGDHCHNVDRIMRLPYTINVPNKKKRSLGRRERLSGVVSQNDKTFDLAVFSPAPLIDGGSNGDIGRPRVELSGNIPRLESVDDLDDHGDVPVHVKMLIVQGMDPDRPDRYPSRSECFWFVICELVRCEIPDDLIASVILDPDFLISGHVLDQKNPEGYAVRQIQRAKEFALNPELPGFNDNHFVTFVGGKIKVAKEDSEEISYMDPGSFEKFYSNKLVEIGTTKDGVPVQKRLGKWWIEHPQRRSYDGVLFDPSGTGRAGHYNLWRGFACQAVAGDKHERFLEHLQENICRGNTDHYNYLISWVARLVQNPASQSETAIVMRGKEGTGKNSFVSVIGSLFPRHYFESSSSQQFLGNFNSHLRDKILVHANEAFFAGDKKHEATLKMLITEPTMPIEAKGVDITMEPNHLHIVMSSNSEWVVPAGPESRRFFVLDVGDKRRGDSAYFAAMKRELDNGGVENLLRMLLDHDLTGFDIRKVPVTEALLDQRIRSMPKMAQWWMARLERGYIINPEDGWMRDVEVEHVWKSYVSDMQEQSENYRSSRIELGRFLSRVVPNLEKKRVQRGGSKRPYYRFPDVKVCRQSFDEVQGGPFKWPELELEVQEDIPF